jgi:putrescine transport system substrate-binding protein
VYPTPDVLAKLVDPVSFPMAVERDRVRLWTTIKTGQ